MNQFLAKALIIAAVAIIGFAYFMGNGEGSINNAVGGLMSDTIAKVNTLEVD